MPGSMTTPGCQSTCDSALCHIAFRLVNGVGTQDKRTIAAQWLAYAYPCQRFALYLSVVTKFAGLLVKLRDGHQMADYAQ